MPPSPFCIPEPLGQALVRIARKTLLERFGRKFENAEEQRLVALTKHPVLQIKAGVFVTLKIDGQLRGCIGSLTGRDALVEGVQINAANAAFSDPRFPALCAQELARLDIEVSVLTPPQPLCYEDSADLIARLRPGIDGVTLRKGFCSATFLPQVWKQLPQPEDFLTHLCLKAGLGGNAWRNSKLEVEIYQVQCFEDDANQKKAGAER